MSPFVYRTVYVVLPATLREEDPAVFAVESDAEKYAEAIELGGAQIFELLVCEGDLAKRMIHDAEGVEE